MTPTAAAACINSDAQMAAAESHFEDTAAEADANEMGNYLFSEVINRRGRGIPTSGVSRGDLQRTTSCGT